MIASLFNRPSDSASLSAFSFANQNHHDLVVDFIRGTGNVSVNRYIMDPISLDDLNNFLIRHQQSHNEINGALNVAGNDLSSLNIRDPNSVEAWLLLHVTEHQQWQFKTAIP